MSAPLLALRTPEGRKAASAARDMRSSLGKYSCKVLDRMASEPERLYSIGQLAQDCGGQKVAVSIVLSQLALAELVGKVRGRWKVTSYGQTIGSAG